MGADGGYCYLHCTNFQEFFRLFGCFLWRYQNLQCRAVKGQRSDDREVPDPGPDYIEGGYGTDCEYSFADVVELIHDVLDDREVWVTMPTDPRNLTFRELIVDLETDPEFDMDRGVFHIVSSHTEWTRWWALDAFRPIAEHLAGFARGYSFAKLDAHIVDMTLLEWCQALRKVGCDHVCLEETWS